MRGKIKQKGFREGEKKIGGGGRERESKRIEEGWSNKIGREENKKDSEGGRKEIGYRYGRK